MVVLRVPLHCFSCARYFASHAHVHSTECAFTSPSLCAEDYMRKIVYILISDSVLVKTRMQNSSRLSCGKSKEHRLLPVIKHRIMPPCHIKLEQINDISHGMWPTMLNFIVTAGESWELRISHSQISSSPVHGFAQIAWFMWYPQTLESRQNVTASISTITEKRLGWTCNWLQHTLHS